MNKYKVQFIQTETFLIDLYAESEEQARTLAEQKWEEGDYQETGDLNVEIDMVYDVTNTDDPFYPCNYELCEECGEQKVYKMFDIPNSHDLVERLTCTNCDNN